MIRSVPNISSNGIMCQWDLNKRHTRPAATLPAKRRQMQLTETFCPATREEQDSLVPAGIPGFLKAAAMCQHLFCSPQGEFLPQVSGCSSERSHCTLQAVQSRSELGVPCPALSRQKQLPREMECCHRPAAQLRSWAAWKDEGKWCLA